MILNFSIPGKPRVKKNQWGRPSREYAAWEKVAVLHCVSQAKGRAMPAQTPLILVVKFYIGTRQSPDLDNLLCGPIDALQKAEVIKNDYFIDEIHAHRFRHNESPGVNITICTKEEQCNSH